MEPMPVTLDVSKEERSRLASFEQPENMPPALEIRSLSESEKLTASSDAQPENM